MVVHVLFLHVMKDHFSTSWMTPVQVYWLVFSQLYWSPLSQTKSSFEWLGCLLTRVSDWCSIVRANARCCLFFFLANQAVGVVRTISIDVVFPLNENVTKDVDTRKRERERHTHKTVKSSEKNQKKKKKKEEKKHRHYRLVPLLFGLVRPSNIITAIIQKRTLVVVVFYCL